MKDSALLQQQLDDLRLGHARTVNGLQKRILVLEAILAAVEASNKPAPVAAAPAPASSEPWPLPEQVKLPRSILESAVAKAAEAKQPKPRLAPKKS